MFTLSQRTCRMQRDIRPPFCSSALDAMNWLAGTGVHLCDGPCHNDMVAKLAPPSGHLWKHSHVNISAKADVNLRTSAGVLRAHCIGSCPHCRCQWQHCMRCCCKCASIQLRLSLPGGAMGHESMQWPCRQPLNLSTSTSLNLHQSC